MIVLGVCSTLVNFVAWPRTTLVSFPIKPTVVASGCVVVQVEADSVALKVAVVGMKPDDVLVRVDTIVV